jgi:hypothetical protein
MGIEWLCRCQPSERVQGNCYFGRQKEEIGSTREQSVRLTNGN